MSCVSLKLTLHGNRAVQPPLPGFSGVIVLMLKRVYKYLPPGLFLGLNAVMCVVPTSFL